MTTPEIVLDSEPEDSVMKEIEDFVKPKRKKKRSLDIESDDVYDMCD
jgi:hypothetical protein